MGLEPDEKAVYTHRQMCQMIARTKSWTLNNPSGELPYLPVQWVNYVSQEQNQKASNETMPPYKKPHKLISFLMFLKIL
jgi:hypothetical protein